MSSCPEEWEALSRVNNRRSPSAFKSIVLHRIASKFHRRGARVMSVTRRPGSIVIRKPTAKSVGPGRNQGEVKLV